MNPSQSRDSGGTCLIELDFQYSEELSPNAHEDLPTKQDVDSYYQTAIAHLLSISTINTVHKTLSKKIELCLRVVDINESKSLNYQYRNKNSATNVLSFESDIPDFVESPYIGDLVVCAEILAQEANNQHKKLHDHWAHICVHGLLHLLGFDHITDEEAEVMEQIEREILAQLNISDPYAIS